MIQMLKMNLPTRREENAVMDRKSDAPSQSFDAILGTLFRSSTDNPEPLRNEPDKGGVAENNQKSDIETANDQESSSTAATETQPEEKNAVRSEDHTIAAETAVSPVLRNLAAASGSVAADSHAKASSNAKKLPHEQKPTDKPTVQNTQKPDMPEALTQKKQNAPATQLAANELNNKKAVSGNQLHRAIEALPLAEKIHQQQPGIFQDLNIKKDANVRPGADRRPASEKKTSALPEDEKSAMTPVRRHAERMTRKTAPVEQTIENKPATQSSLPLQAESPSEKSTVPLTGKQNQDAHREGNQFGTEQQIRRHNMASNAPESLLQRASFSTELKELIDSARISVRDGRNATMSIKMNPEDLGKLELTMGLEDGVLTARFTVESEEARELLSANLETMRERLGAEGLSVGQLFVDVRGGRERRDAMPERIWQGPLHRTESVSEIYELADTVSDGHFNMVM